MLPRILVSSLLAYLLVRLFVPHLRTLANRLGLVDEADSDRKVHTDRVPLVGGLAMGLSAIAILLLNAGQTGPVSGLSTTLLAGSSLLLITGIIDDRHDLNPFLKLAIQLCCASLVVAQGIEFDETFALFGLEGLPLAVKQAITVAFVVGLVNAYNLIDGIDGLAGSLFLIAFAWLGGLALVRGQAEVALLCGVLVAVVWGFLGFNTARKGKIFMGDGGSLLLGFMLAGLCIVTLEGSVDSGYAGAIATGTATLLGLPLLDELRVFAVRIARGRSPFFADRTHIHHILLQIDPRHRRVRHWILGLVVGEFVLATGLALAIGPVAAAVGIALSALALLGLLSVQDGMDRQRRALRRLEMP